MNHKGNEIQILTSIPPSYLKDLGFDNSTGYYYYLWNTSGLLPGNDYVVEANLYDYDFNVDANGSNDTGPDLVLGLLDLTPPIVSVVDTQVITSSLTDSDECYELGATVRIQVYELNFEKGLLTNHEWHQVRY